MKKINGEKYKILIGSDLNRDGMFAELSKGDKNIYIGEIFYSDITDNFTISLKEKDLDLEILEWFINYSKKRLLPIKK